MPRKSAAVTLKMSAARPALVSIVADTNQPGALRADALTALDKLGEPKLADAVAIALASDAPALRLAALPISSRLTPESAVAMLAKLLENGTPDEQRAAFKALGESKNSEADTLLLAQLTRLAAGQVAPSAQLELVEAAALRTDPRVKQAIADRDAILAKDPDPLAAFRVCLEGGNLAASIRTFTAHPVMQCIRCHRIGDWAGGEAGPNLAGIGARATREYILESLIKPSAKIAAGFEIVTVTKKNGEAIVGTLASRDDQVVRLRSGETEVTEIAQADIQSIVSAPSAMPEIAALVLTKAEIRNLVEGLYSLKEPAKPRDQLTLRALRPSAE